MSRRNVGRPWNNDEMRDHFAKIRADAERRGELLLEAGRTGRSYRELLIEAGFPDSGPPLPCVRVHQCPTCGLISRSTPCPFSHDRRA